MHCGLGAGPWLAHPDQLSASSLEAPCRNLLDSQPLCLMQLPHGVVPVRPAQLQQPPRARRFDQLHDADSSRMWLLGQVVGPCKRIPKWRRKPGGVSQRLYPEPLTNAATPEDKWTALLLLGEGASLLLKPAAE